MIAAGLLALLLASPEPLERRLLRTIQIGAAQQVEEAEMRAHAKAPEGDFVGHCLARAALAVLGRDEGFPEWPLERLLDRSLSLLTGGGTNSFSERPGMPARFGGEDLAFTLVYALAVMGTADKAVDVLEARLGSDSDLARGVALQALRNLGTPRANALVEKAGEKSRDRNLPENLMADLYHPFLSELASRLPLIPPAERTRGALLQAASEACGERSALAVYFLGFFADTQGPEDAAELARLRELTRAPCFYTRYFAIRSLGLRSPETREFWTTLLGDTEDAWQRALIVDVAFARFGRDFADDALRLLAEEPAQYVQWELMHGTLDARAGVTLRDWWDVWQPTTLAFRLYFSEGKGRLPPADLEAILSWLESGARPRDEWVRNHLLYRLAGQVAGRQTRRYLRVFDALPDKTRHFWILAGLDDPQALPLLRFWQTQPGEEETQQAELGQIVERLQQGARQGNGDGSPEGPCCEPTLECLVATATARSSAPTPAVVTSAAEAQAWLQAADPGPPFSPTVRFADELRRDAVVTFGQRKERWEHLYGCWHLTRAGAGPTGAGFVLPGEPSDPERVPAQPGIAQGQDQARPGSS